MFGWIIIGAGFTGAVLAERIASQLNQKVLLLDRRDHIAGNAFDYTNEDGILIHKYGPHIFHTNSKKVWDYLQDFSSWRPYEHCVLASVDGMLIPVPFNLNSIDQCFPTEAAERYRKKLIDRFGEGAKVPILTLKKEQDTDLKTLAGYVYEKVFRNYTFKQWGLLPEQLSPSVTARVPIFVSRDNRYFQDEYQALPLQGYTALVKSMLNHPLITLRLNNHFGQKEYYSIKELSPQAKFIFTGPIGEFFDRRFGALPYRSLCFEHRTFSQQQKQFVGTVNFPNEHKYTRITEIKHITGQKHDKTTLTYEYPEPYAPGTNEPYYPIPREETQALFNKYRAYADEWKDIYFCGRLGDYKYYNMDQAIAAALTLFEKQIAR